MGLFRAPIQVAYPVAGVNADGGNKSLESGLEGAAAYNQLQADYEADKVLFRRNESELKEALTYVSHCFDALGALPVTSRYFLSTRLL